MFDALPFYGAYVVGVVTVCMLCYAREVWPLIFGGQCDSTEEMRRFLVRTRISKKYKIIISGLILAGTVVLVLLEVASS